MTKFAPLIIVDDDPEDREIVREVCESLGIRNKLVFLSDGREAIEYLRSEAIQPFLILCDVNMPVINGLRLRELINQDENLKRKAIPFVFLSTTASERDVTKAYDMTVQGFFEKGSNFEKLRHKIYIIMEYWRECRAPKFVRED